VESREFVSNPAKVSSRKVKPAWTVFAVRFVIRRKTTRTDDMTVRFTAVRLNLLEGE